MLLELMLHKIGISPTQIIGYENTEFTHSAVAAFIASGMADVGIGVQTAAARFKLDFIPLLKERYFFALPSDSLGRPEMRQVIEVMCSGAFRSAVNQLPGYDASETGTILTLEQAFGATR